MTWPPTLLDQRAQVAADREALIADTHEMLLGYAATPRFRETMQLVIEQLKFSDDGVLSVYSRGILRVFTHSQDVLHLLRADDLAPMLVHPNAEVRAAAMHALPYVKVPE